MLAGGFFLFKCCDCFAKVFITMMIRQKNSSYSLHCLELYNFKVLRCPDLQTNKPHPQKLPQSWTRNRNHSVATLEWVLLYRWCYYCSHPHVFSGCTHFSASPIKKCPCIPNTSAAFVQPRRQDSVSLNLNFPHHLHKKVKRTKLHLASALFFSPR